MFKELMPHGQCFLWEPGILWPYLIGNTLTAVSYFTIPIIFLVLLRRRKTKTLPMARMLVIYGLFILFCGIGHVMMVLNVYQGWYQAEALLNVLTGMISVLAAHSSIAVLKKALGEKV